MLTEDALPERRGLLAMEKTDLSTAEKAALIDASQWAHPFSFAQIKKLATYLDVYQVPVNTVLFYEGERNPYLVLIASGLVHVVKYDSVNNPKRIASLGPGKTIGEMGLIDGQPRSATAITGSEATLLVMTADQFQQLNQRLPGIGIILVLKIAKLMSQYLRSTSGRLIDRIGN